MQSWKIIRKLSRVLVWLFSIVIGLVLLVFVVFSVYRGKIYTKILTTVNAGRPGELLVDHIHIAPVGFYPFLAIRLDSVTFYEHKKEFRDESSIPVIELQTLYVGFKYNNLIKGDFRLGGISMENGYLNLKVNPDSTLNLLNGFRPYKKSPSPASEKATDPLGKLDLVEMYNLVIRQNNGITGENWQLSLKEVSNYYSELGDTVKANLHAEVEVNTVYSKERNILKDKTLNLDLEYIWSLSSLNGTIDSGKLSFGQLDMDVNGSFHSGIPARYDLNFLIDTHGLDTVSIDDPNTIIADIPGGRGKVIVNGVLRGNTVDRIPFAEVDIQIEDLAIDDPFGDSTLHDINLTGHFTTGDSSDLSQAELKIDHMNLMAGSDYHTGSLMIRNFITPQVSLNLDSRIEMRDLDAYFHFDFINNLDGVVEISADVDGTLDFENNKILENGGAVGIRFDDFSFHIPETKQHIDHINGTINLIEDRINLDGISVSAGQDDLLINGSISNLLYIFSKQDKPIEGIFNFQSDQLALEDLVSQNSEPDPNHPEVITDLDLDLKINTTTHELKSPSFLPDGTVHVNSLSANVSYLPEKLNLSGLFSISEDTQENYIFSIKDLDIRSGEDNLLVNGLLTSSIEPASPVSSPVVGKMEFESDRLALSTVFAFDTLLAETYKEVFTDARVILSYESTLEDVLSNWYLPRGEVSLDHISAKMKTRSDISDTHGSLLISDSKISFNELEGVYGKSDIKFSCYVENYPGFWITDSVVEIDIGFSAHSDLMRADDFFTYKDNFYLLGKYKGEFLEDFSLSANFHYINMDLFEAQSLPDATIEITDMQWITSYDKLFFRDFYARLERKGDNLGLHDFRGKIGESDFAFNAKLKNFTPFTDPDLSELSAEFNIRAANLDLNELTGIKFPKAEQPKFNPFKFIYYDLTLNLDIEKLSYEDFLINNIKGELSTERNHKIHLNAFSLETAGGELHLEADLDTENPEDIIMSSKIIAYDILIEKILLNFKLKDQEISPGDYFKGVLDLNIESDLHMDPGFKIDLYQTHGNLGFSLEQGQVVDFPPLQELAKYFGDKDLTNVRLTGKGKGIQVDSGMVTVPRMAVNSTLGHLYFAGVYDADLGHDYIFEVPFKLIASTAWGMLVGRSREEDATEDEIQKPSKGAYVTLHLQGNKTDGFGVKLGKGKKKKRSRNRKSL